MKARLLLDNYSQSFWAIAGALVLVSLCATIFGFERAVQLLVASSPFVGFYVIVGIGQMLVITSGPGNIDLSIPATMTLSGYLALGLVTYDKLPMPAGVAAGLAIGLGMGLFNAAMIIVMRIPPMIATLAGGFILQSVAVAYSRGSTAAPAHSIAYFAQWRVLGLSSIFLISVLALVSVGTVLGLSVYGRYLEGAGQNQVAARLSKIPVMGVTLSVYCLSGLLAATAGILFASFSGGASLAMGEEFLLVSIAVVVLGGTSVAGGRYTLLGTLAGAVFLFYAVTMLNVLQFSAGVRSVITGIIIVTVLGFRGRN